MIVSLVTSLTRIVIFWYLVGILVLFLGDPAWAESLYLRLSVYPGVPTLELKGLTGAAKVQGTLLAYWTAPVLLVWMVAIGIGAMMSASYGKVTRKMEVMRLKPSGYFWGVEVYDKSIGKLPTATVPALVGQPVIFEGVSREGPAPKDAAKIKVQGSMLEALKLLTLEERSLCEELIQLLLASPNHFAGLGHGVGLLEHTLNVVTEAADKCTPEFRMPLIAALAHDIGKLITFQPDNKGGWVRKGLHSRESARILATLPSFSKLPIVHQDALLLAVKYDHAPNKMPALREEKEATMLAMRIISALSQADRTATAGEKERNLVKLKPEDLLWEDFATFLREAPVVQRGKKGVDNQVNNPPDSPFLFIYEASWRDAAVARLPAEVAAALDLNRRDSGKIAKYTKILVERLKKEGLLVDTYQDMSVSDANPLWDIDSGTAAKSIVIRGVLALNADLLWKKLNYKLSVKSPFPVKIVAPNANAEGHINQAPTPGSSKEVPVPETADTLKVDITDPKNLAVFGLGEEGAGSTQKGRLKRSKFKPAEPTEEKKSFTDMLYSKTDVPYSPEETKDPVNTSTSTEAVATAQIAEKNNASAENVSVVPVDKSGQEDVSQEPGSDASAAAHEPSASEFASTLSAIALISGLGGEQKNDSTDQVPVMEEPEMPVQEPAESPTSKEEVSPEEIVAKPTETTAKASVVPNLSRSEQKSGIAIVDEAVKEKYPNLEKGDKYYTADAPLVKSGKTKEGTRYNGGNNPPNAVKPPKANMLYNTDGNQSRGPRRPKLK